ncbi:MAG: hypothetical protein ACR2MP_12335 [Streptosporangiaceae bacterium]
MLGAATIVGEAASAHRFRSPDAFALWVPKTCAARADAPPNAIGAVPRPVPGEPVWPVRACDDPRFAGLKLIFLIVSGAVSLLVLSRRESWWKDAEILMVRHHLAVAQRERPQAQSRLTWPDRAWLALLAGTLPIERLAAMRLIVTPDTILGWHREILRRRRARLSRRARSGRPPVRRDVRSVVLRLGTMVARNALAVGGLLLIVATRWDSLGESNQRCR